MLTRSICICIFALRFLLRFCCVFAAFLLRFLPCFCCVLDAFFAAFLTAFLLHFFCVFAAFLLCFCCVFAAFLLRFCCVFAAFLLRFCCVFCCVFAPYDLTVALENTFLEATARLLQKRITKTQLKIGRVNAPFLRRLRNL